MLAGLMHVSIDRRVGVTHPRKPRGALGRLLEAGKTRSGREWPDIDYAAGITKTTREAWINGRTAEPGLAGVLRLTRVLGIHCSELEASVLDGRLPAWVTGVEIGRDAGSSAAEGMSAKAGRAARRALHRRSNGHGQA